MTPSISKLTEYLLENEQLNLPFSWEETPIPEPDFNDLLAASEEKSKKQLEVGATYARCSGNSKDVIRDLLVALEWVDQAAYDTFVADNTEVMAYLENEDAELEYDWDVVSELEGDLSDYTPPYTYFGSNEGDGSLGVWVSTENLKEAIEEGTVAQFDTVAEWEEGGIEADENAANAEYVFIGDRDPDGTGSLYRVADRELIWRV